MGCVLGRKNKQSFYMRRKLLIFPKLLMFYATISRSLLLHNPDGKLSCSRQTPIFSQIKNLILVCIREKSNKYWSNEFIGTKAIFTHTVFWNTKWNICEWLRKAVCIGHNTWVCLVTLENTANQRNEWNW